MILAVEDLGDVLCGDMPKDYEYEDVIRVAFEAGKRFYKYPTESATGMCEARERMYRVLAQCIARGIRIERERNTR